MTSKNKILEDQDLFLELLSTSSKIIRQILSVEQCRQISPRPKFFKCNMSIIVVARRLQKVYRYHCVGQRSNLGLHYEGFYPDAFEGEKPRFNCLWMSWRNTNTKCYSQSFTFR